MNYTVTFALALCVAGSAFGDAITFNDRPKYADVTVTGYQDGKLLATVKAGEKQFELAKVETIDLAAAPRFVEAEQARVKDPKRAASLYRDCIRAINDPGVKQLAELRAVGPMDADGRYLEAVTYFLDTFAASPTEATWKLRPTHVPAAGSTMLVEAGERIELRLGDFSAENVKKELRTLQLELYSKAGDPRADTLVKELTTGIVESNGAKPAAQAAGAGAGNPVESVQAAIKANDFAGAIQKADEMMAGAPEETAIRLYELKALAYQGQNNADGAAATLLRIASYYPASMSAATALLMAADIEKKQNHAAAAQRLYQEIREKYPTSPEAIKAAGRQVEASELHDPAAHHP